MYGKPLVVAAVLAVLLQHGMCSMSEAQLKAATKLVRNVCQPKLKISSDAINAFHKGDFNVDQTAKCYMECCLKMGKLSKDGKLDLESFKKQALNMPAPRVDASLASGEACKEAGAGLEKCEMAYQIYKCIYDSNPSNFILP